MAHATPTSTTVSSSSRLISLLEKSSPNTLPTPPNSEHTTADLLKSTYPRVSYTDAEKDAITQWLTTSSHISPSTEDAAKTTERLTSLNTHLSTRTTLLGSKPSVADVAMYVRLAPEVRKWSSEERTGYRGYHHIVRWIDFVQNAEEVFGLKVDEIERVGVDAEDVRCPIKPIDAKAEKERRKKEKEAATAGGGETTLPLGHGKDGGGRKSKKEANQEQAAEANGAAPDASAQQKQKKEKQPKPQKNPPAAEKPLSPSLIDLRVGHILKATNHPNADSLYVSTIAVGDPPGTDNTSSYDHTDGKAHTVRTVCSGLNGLVPLEEMQGRKVVAVCNLKPVTMRGIKSCAMVLAASPRSEGDGHAGPVELVSPSSKAQAGERCWFEGWQEGEPEAVLNPKKKVWETCQVGFTTTEGCEVGFEKGAVEPLKDRQGVGDVGKLVTKSGVCRVKSLKGATVR